MPRRSSRKGPISTRPVVNGFDGPQFPSDDPRFPSIVEWSSSKPTSLCLARTQEGLGARGWAVECSLRALEPAVHDRPVQDDLSA